MLVRLKAMTALSGGFIFVISNDLSFGFHDLVSISHHLINAFI